jgi:superfamily I DNA/RNA helicase
MMQAVDRLGAQYDAVVVDEGQDFHDNWWGPLQCMLRDEKQGIFYVFFDDNQNIYRVAQHVPLQLAPFPLTRNCRSTQHIHAQVMQFYRSDVSPIAIGPQGRPVEKYRYADATELKRLLRQLLHRLTIEEEVPAWDIVLLTPKGRQRSQLWSMGYLGNYSLTDEWTGTSGEVYCTTVHKFKGLESPVVILTEIDEADCKDLATVLYVGCSRARNHLVLLVGKNLPATVTAQLEGKN